jgi:hypothetical protein
MTDRETASDEAGRAAAAPPAATKRRRSTARKPGARKPAARRPAARRKTRDRKSAGAGVSFESVIHTITGGVAVARAAIAEASGQGATAMWRAVGSASTASRRTVKRLAREWKAMDPKKKARILTALVGVAAAASAPLVRKTFKK